MVQRVLQPRRLRTIFVDDNPDDQFLVEELSQTFTYPIELETASTFEEAERLCSEELADIILVDLNLMSSSGMEPFEIAKRLFPECAIVLLTGDSRSETAVQCLKSGAQDYLVKGHFDANDLEKAIRFSHERHIEALKMQRQSDLINLMLNTQSIGLLEISEDRIITHTNDAACHMLGLTRDKLVNSTPPFDLLDSPSQEFEYLGSDQQKKLLEPIPKPSLNSFCLL